MPERAVTITRRGQPVLTILPREFYAGIVETLAILGDRQMVKALREGLEDLEHGPIVGHAEAKKRRWSLVIFGYSSTRAISSRMAGETSRAKCSSRPAPGCGRGFRLRSTPR
jgi:hypothetical protein